jgi:beta-glucanase (GH16 family)
MDWQKDHVAWYIDGVKCGQFTATTSEVESGPMYIIVNNVVDNDWIHSCNVALQDLTLVRRAP